MVRLRPYPEYKPATLPGLDSIPNHWQVLPGFSAFRQKQEKNTGMLEKTVLSLSYGHIIIKPEEKLHGLVPASFETYQIINPGDIIIRPTDMQNDHVSLRVGLAHNRGIITSAYLCLKSTDTLTQEYGYYLLHAYDLMKVFYGMGSGLRQNLDYSDIKRMPVLVPPRQEQIAITNFLDQLNIRITRLIRLKRQQIALLNEQKQAIIQQAVTRGLDPTVRLKPSGVEWLGDIPEHWEVIPLRHLGIKFGSGMTPRGGANVYQSSGIPLIRSQNVHFDGLRLDEIVYISKEIHADMSGTHIKPGDVLLNITGASIGRVCVAPDDIGEANVNQHVSIIRPIINKIKPDYLSAFLSSPFIQNEISGSAEGAAREGLPQKDMKVLPIVVPPIQEQIKIIKWLNISNNRINSATRIAKHEIDLLNEYRTRLIADVVTGKLDVRGVELPEIEIIEDEEIFEEAGDLPEDDLEVEIDGQDGYE